VAHSACQHEHDNPLQSSQHRISSRRISGEQHHREEISQFFC
jgi:hypothetical protein